MIPIPKRNWKISDRISFLSLGISIVGLAITAAIGMFAYRTQARFSDLQEVLLRSQNAPKIRITGYALETWFGDESEFVSLAIENTGNLMAVNITPALSMSWTRKTPKLSKQWNAIKNTFALDVGEHTRIPSFSLTEIKEDIERANPQSRFLFIASDAEKTDVIGFSRVRPDIYDQIQKQHGGVSKTLEVPVIFEIKYGSELGHVRSSFFKMTAVLDVTDRR